MLHPYIQKPEWLESHICFLHCHTTLLGKKLWMKERTKKRWKRKVFYDLVQLRTQVRATSLQLRLHWSSKLRTSTVYGINCNFSSQGIELLPKRKKEKKKSIWNLCVFHISSTVFYKLWVVSVIQTEWCLSMSTDLNAKGAILNAFEMFRLKSCVDFKPYEGESSYIIFQKFSGLVWNIGKREKLVSFSLQTVWKTWSE